MILVASGCASIDTAFRTNDHKSGIDEIDPFDYGDEFVNAGRIKTDRTPGGGDRKSGAQGRIETGESETTMPGEANAGRSQKSESTFFTDPSWNNAPYQIQVGVYENRDNADAMVRRIKSQFDLPVDIIYNPPFYRVRVGHFTDKSEAEKYVHLIRNKGFTDARWVHANISEQ